MMGSKWSTLHVDGAFSVSVDFVQQQNHGRNYKLLII